MKGKKMEDKRHRLEHRMMKLDRLRNFSFLVQYPLFSQYSLFNIPKQ